MDRNYRPINKVVNCNSKFNWVGCGGMMIRRSAVEKLGSFDIVFNPCYFEDPDYCFRAYYKSLSVGWNSQSLIIHQPEKTDVQKQERGKFFILSHKNFTNKWKGIIPPSFLNKTFV
jgi:GT2 family glycosyltransferase